MITHETDPRAWGVALSHAHLKVDAARQIDGWMTELELRWLAYSAGLADQRIVEVGCWKGRSTRALLDNTTATVFAVDDWRGVEDPTLDAADARRDFQRNTAEFGPAQLRVVHASSIDARARLRQMFGEHWADLIFIDAAHDYASVVSDIGGWGALVRPGGTLAGHDYWNPQFPGVTQAVDEIFRGNALHYESIWWTTL